MPFTPERPFQITPLNRILFSSGAFGDVQVEIRVFAPDGTQNDETREELARAICDFLNERYPVKKD